ncbi:MAG TPA: transketolase [Patescibacteria group bacterium]
MLFPARRPHHPLEKLARSLRFDLLDMIYYSGSGHIGGSLSALDLLISLYYSELFKFLAPDTKVTHDHFILSAGHLCPSLYTVLASKGYFSKELLPSYASFGSILQGHVSVEVPGVEYSSGALGQGLSFASGLALADRDHFTVCLTSDGEHDEGQVWEAVAFANKYHLGNLINIVDFNGLQIDGRTADIMPLGDLAAKYRRFGWTVTTVDGHNFYDIYRALIKAKNASIYPVCIIAKTILGKGVSYMENNFAYHDVKSLSQELYLQAQSDLKGYLSHD